MALLEQQDLLKLFIISVTFFVVVATYEINEVVSQPDTYIIEGKVFPPDTFSNSNWQTDTTVFLKGGYHIGYLKEDGSFVINNVPSGSYVVEVVNPNYVYEPVRVEINSKGKYRARKVNYIQTSQVIQVPYPLKMKPLSPARYFQVREQWRATDFLFNPMVLMMVLPLLLVMVLPRMMNDPETRKEMEQLNNLTKYDIPEVSEMITCFFGGDKQKPKSIKSSKKGNRSTN
ncbi:ER membrane protein complex subunit 7 [Lycorma delicatula]|uniref:ER membrane protein complex subunit 7 n=1 Tax=Lycorma delicatula TaxID=130591 RepID=UPI003F517860